MVLVDIVVAFIMDRGMNISRITFQKLGDLFVRIRLFAVKLSRNCTVSARNLRLTLSVLHIVDSQGGTCVRSRHTSDYYAWILEVILGSLESVSSSLFSRAVADERTKNLVGQLDLN